MVERAQSYCGSAFTPLQTVLSSIYLLLLALDLIRCALSDDDKFFHEASLTVNAEIVKILYQEVIPSFIEQPWALTFAANAW